MTQIDEVFARLAMHELALEIIMSAMLSAMPWEISERIKSDMKIVAERGYGSIPANDSEMAERLQAIGQAVPVMFARFMEKTAAREIALRQAAAATAPARH